MKLNTVNEARSTLYSISNGAPFKPLNILSVSGTFIAKVNYLSFSEAYVTAIFLYQGQGDGSKQSSPAGLRHIDADLKDRGRRRSSAYSIIDDEDIPLTHKTGTVGIVALALRNRNEKKKDAEFKVRKKLFTQTCLNEFACTIYICHTGLRAVRFMFIDCISPQNEFENIGYEYPTQPMFSSS